MTAGSGAAGAANASGPGSLNEARLLRGAEKLGLTLDETARGRFATYARLLAQWGDAINLTALRDPHQVLVRHFLDSLALVRHLPATDALPAPTLVDVGSGAGFPGAVCALMRPDLRVTLVERVGKKAAFLMALRRELGLSYEVEAQDAERLMPPAGPGFGLVVSRACLPIAKWLPFAARLAQPGAAVFAMISVEDALPPLPSRLTMRLDTTYDVGAGPHRLLGLRAS